MSMNYDDKEMNRNGQMLLSIAAGVAIGIVVGGALTLLFTPKSGAQVRGDIGDAIDDLKDKAEKVVDDLQVSTSELLTRTRSMLDETRENLIRSVEAGKEAYTETREELSAQLETQ
ncbi:MAG: YtxH domain-containing protein [Armatimonadaceae bacterium]